MRYWILILILCAGCKSAEQLAIERAMKAEIIRQKDEARRRDSLRQEIAIADKVRAMKPCDTVRVVSRDTSYQTIPGDTVVRVVTVTQVKAVIDMAMVSAARDSLSIEQITTGQLRRQASDLQQQIVQLSAEKASQEQRNEELQAEKKKESRQKWITWGILIALAAGSIAFSVAKKIIL